MGLSFDKPATSIYDQISLLKKRNLIIINHEEVFHYLSTIGYYRLSNYFKPFLMSKENIDVGFKENTQFSDILNLYVFDRELRLLVMDDNGMSFIWYDFTDLFKY